MNIELQVIITLFHSQVLGSRDHMSAWTIPFSEIFLSDETSFEYPPYKQICNIKSSNHSDDETLGGIMCQAINTDNSEYVTVIVYLPHLGIQIIENHSAHLATLHQA